VPVGDHLEDLVDVGHKIGVDVVVVVGIVESVGSLTRANDLTLLGFPISRTGTSIPADPAIEKRPASFS
jgi:hypothetical protein